jgi:hypothetical protein
VVLEPILDSRLPYSSSIVPMANLPVANANIVSAAVSIHTSIQQKLNKDNYRLWKSIIVPILKGHSLFRFVDDTLSCPPPTLTSSDADVEVITHNP